MRNITIILLSALTLLTISACTKTKGTGDIFTESRAVADFTQVRSDISGDVYINQGYRFEVTVEAAEDLLPLIETNLDGNLLTIRYKQHIVLKPTQSIKVRITMPVIHGVIQKGSGKIDCDDFVQVEHDLYVDMNGSGNVNVNKLVGRIANTNIAGSGNVTISSGSVANSQIQINGSGSVNQFDVVSDNADINVAGSGNVRLNVTNYMKVVITGSGDVHYSGSPKIDAWVTGSGRVKKM